MNSSTPGAQMHTDVRAFAAANDGGPLTKRAACQRAVFTGTQRRGHKGRRASLSTQLDAEAMQNDADKRCRRCGLPPH
eukprot:11166353-Lingulodinium_polyedra.AAC.1